MCDIRGLQCVCTVVRSSPLPPPPLPHPKCPKGLGSNLGTALGEKVLRHLAVKFVFQASFSWKHFPPTMPPRPPPQKKNVDFFFLRLDRPQYLHNIELWVGVSETSFQFISASFSQCLNYFCHPLWLHMWF